MKKLIIFIGSPGMNNIELARYLQVRKYPKSIIVDRYDSWLDYPDEPYNSKLIEFDLYRRIEDALEKTDIVMVIAPFVLRVDRANFFFHFRNKLDDIETIGVWVERKYEDLKTLIQLRLPYRKVTEETFEYLFNHRESLTEDEPFDNIYYITREVNIGMSKSDPYIADILTVLDKI